MLCDDLGEYGGKEVQEGGVICIQIVDSLCCIAETNTTFALISHASKVMLKILQARLQQFMNHELPVVQAGFRKGRQRPNCQNLLDHGKSKRVPEKHLFLL